MIVREKSISRQASMEACLFAIQKAEELKIAINVSIADNKGLEMAFLRMENSYIHSSEIAKDKAYTSASFGFPSDTWTEIFKQMPHLEQGFSNRARLIPFCGGFGAENCISITSIVACCLLCSLASISFCQLFVVTIKGQNA